MTGATAGRLCGTCGLCLTGALAWLSCGAAVAAKPVDARVSASAPLAETSAPGLPTGVSVQVSSGRSFFGDVDGRTDATELWLRSGDKSLSIVRPIDWDSVREVVVGRRTVSGREFGEFIKSLGPQAADPPRPALGRRIVMRGDEGRGSAGRSSTSEDRGPRLGRRVASLAIDAWTANWDADAEVDGLIVEVTPCDAEGVLVPVWGTLEVRLSAQRRAGGKYPEPFDMRQRWTEQVRPSDFGRGAAAARYRLGFTPSASNPEFDGAVARYGAVVVELSVPGQGTYSATASSVRLRPPSPVRDALERATGERFFPGENAAP